MHTLAKALAIAAIAMPAIAQDIRTVRLHETGAGGWYVDATTGPAGTLCSAMVDNVTRDGTLDITFTEAGDVIVYVWYAADENRAPFETRANLYLQVDDLTKWTLRSATWKPGSIMFPFENDDGAWRFLSEVASGGSIFLLLDKPTPATGWSLHGSRESIEIAYACSKGEYRGNVIDRGLN